MIPLVHFILKFTECLQGRIEMVPGLRTFKVPRFWGSEDVPPWERKGVGKSQQGWIKDCSRTYVCFILSNGSL